MRKEQLFIRQLLLAAALFFGGTVGAQDVVGTQYPSAGYDKGFFVDHGNDYRLRINGRLQTRAQYSYKDSSHHDFAISVPNARLLFGGHVFDPRIGFNSQLAFDNGNFKLVDFYANLGLLREDLHLKIGNFAAGFSLLEAYSAGKLGLNSRSFLFDTWKVDSANGVALYRSKNRTFGFELGVFENGVGKDLLTRRGAVSATLSFNHNELNSTDEMDFEGGPFRLLVSAGGFGRVNIDSWKFVGYAGAFEAITKFHNMSLLAGMLTGVPEVGSLEQNGIVIQEDIKSSKLGLGAYAQGGHVFDKKFGLSARYALKGDFSKAPSAHEILGGASVYLHDHNLKFTLDGGAYLAENKVHPLVRAQFQLAF